MKSANILDHTILVSTVSLDRWQHRSLFFNGEHWRVAETKSFWLRRARNRLALRNVCAECVFRLPRMWGAYEFSSTVKPVPLIRKKVAWVFVHGDMSFRPRSVEGFKSRRFRPCENQVALKPVEGYIHFRTPLLFMSASPQRTTKIPGFPGMRLPRNTWGITRLAVDFLKYSIFK
jgi:hypothetical protein